MEPESGHLTAGHFYYVVIPGGVIGDIVCKKHKLTNMGDKIIQDLSKVIKQALSRGGEFADLFLENRSTTMISCEDNKIEDVVSGIEAGAGLRVINRQRTVYAHTNDLSGQGLLGLAGTLSQGVENATEKITVKTLEKPQPVPRVNIDGLSTADKVALLERTNKIVRAMDKRVVQVKVVYGDFRQNIKIVNSLGLFRQDERRGFVFMVQVVAADGDLIQTGHEVYGGSAGYPMISGDKAAELANLAGKRALMMLEARPAPAGKMTVVLAGEAGGTMVHEAIGHGLEADLAQNGLSVYSNRVGEQVASPLINVIDDATMPNMRGSYRFDDEGVEAQNTLLVEKGVLRGYLYDRLSAMKDGAASTGNGRRQSYKHIPIPRMTNTIISPGESDPREIVRSVKNGLLVTRLGGGQVNTVNGDFVFDVSEGYLIENGEAVQPIRGANLIGNGPQILKEVEAVGNDIGYAIGTCGKDGQGAPVSDGQPTLLLPRIVVGGTGG